MVDMDNELVAAAFQRMPGEVRKKLLKVRALIFSVAADNGDVGPMDESLKWGEPSYASARGSAIRLGWKSSAPTEYRVLFNCQTKLLDTFRELYPDQLQLEGKRAIVFRLDEAVAEQPLKHCIELALNYHRLKHLPLLGC